MKIAIVASEMVPFSKTGGLAEVIGTLSREIRGLGHEVRVFVPRYRSTPLKELSCERVIESLAIALGSETEQAQVYRCQHQGIQVYFIEHKGFFDRSDLYGTVAGDYPDNDRRFVFFQKAVCETLHQLRWAPNIVHCHDWQTALIPTYLKTVYAKEAFFEKTRTVLTIHNLAYQGNFPPDSLALTGFGWEHFTLERMEFFGKVSFLKTGIVDADTLTTVSERYAMEIRTKEFGAGMEGVLNREYEKIKGIVNGIDLEEWNPSQKEVLPAAYSDKDLSGKAVCKSELQKENDLKVDPAIPLVGLISRLIDQKGLSILFDALPQMMELGFQFVLLGTGEEKYHRALREFGRKFRGQAGIHILFDRQMAKRIYAGADMILMPSYYEPCGLGQMIALRYGTVPVVRATGGLADTIVDFDTKTEIGNGFSFEEYHGGALLGAVERAVQVFRRPKSWAKVIANAMAYDFSWTASAKKYIQMYEKVRRKPLQGLKSS